MFDGRYMGALLRGEKTSTVRPAARRIPKPGEEVMIHCGGKVLGRARVDRVVFKPLRELDDEDARAGGFGSRDELIGALRRHYPDLGDDDLVAVIRFSWVRRFERPVSSEEYAWGAKIDPVELAREALSKMEDLKPEEREMLELLVREGSIRRAARRIGGLHKRYKFRILLRRIVRAMKERRGE